MTIISLSINEKLLRDIDKLEKELGFSGRSEVIRAGLRMLLADKKEKSRLKGVVDAVLLAIHEDKHSEQVSAIRHKYQDIIKTQIHNHLENHRCLEIFVLNGDSEQVKKISDELQTSRKIDFVKLILS